MSGTIAVIGAGPGGLAAAKGARGAGADRLIILERNDETGGILNQCIHDGFGLIRYGKHLSGPQYAELALHEAKESGAEILTGHHVIRIDPESAGYSVVTISRNGVESFHADAVILSTGCRERTRGAISIPGPRPSGIYTAGTAQNLINQRNILPGKKAVILGSGDIGMIMARRLRLEGAEVVSVIEILPEPAGLARNVSQCLYDFDIPLRCSHTVSRIIGKKRIEAVEISRVDDSRKPIPGTVEIIPCDTLILSVGLIPENEVAETAGVKLNETSNGAVTDAYLQTSAAGIFACGNSRAIMDLADYVSEQGEIAGYNAAAWIHGKKMKHWDAIRGTMMKKGFPEPGTITCTLCPNGCQVKAVHGVISGNRCPKGAAFFTQESVSPKRTVTTTIKTADGKLLPVHAGTAVRKDDVLKLVQKISHMTLSGKVQCDETIGRIRLGDYETEVIASASSD